MVDVVVGDRFSTRHSHSLQQLLEYLLRSWIAELWVPSVTEAPAAVFVRPKHGIIVAPADRHGHSEHVAGLGTHDLSINCAVRQR